MLNVPAPTCLSTLPTQSLPHLHPTTKPSMPPDLSASQVQNSSLLVYLLSIFSILSVTLRHQSLIIFILSSFLRLCIGHHIPCAVLPFPYVCCQTAHSHDGWLPWNPGNTFFCSLVLIFFMTLNVNE